MSAEAHRKLRAKNRAAYAYRPPTKLAAPVENDPISEPGIGVDIPPAPGSSAVDPSW